MKTKLDIRQRQFDTDKLQWLIEIWPLHFKATSPEINSTLPY